MAHSNTRLLPPAAPRNTAEGLLPASAGLNCTRFPTPPLAPLVMFVLNANEFAWPRYRIFPDVVPSEVAWLIKNIPLDIRLMLLVRASANVAVCRPGFIALFAGWLPM